MDKIRKTEGSKEAFAAFPLKEETAQKKALPPEPAQKDGFSKSPQNSLNLIPPQPTSAQRNWTVFHFLIQAPGIGQEPLDGVKKEAGEKLKVISAELSPNGKVIKEFKPDKSKTEETDLSLKQFLKEQMKKYPARHYLLDFSGHSVDFRPLVPRIAQDLKESGQKFDILKFSSCTMAQADVAAQFKDTADYYIASEGFAHGKSFLADLKTWGESQPESLDSPQKVAQAILAKDAQDTHSVLNLAKFPQLLKGIKTLGEAVLKVKKADLPQLKQIINKAQHFAQQYPLEKSPLIDIKDLALKLKNSPSFTQKYPDLVQAALDLNGLVEKEIVTQEIHFPGGKAEFILGKIVPLGMLGFSLAGALTGLGMAGGSSAVATWMILSLFSAATVTKALSQGFLYENVREAGGLSLFMPVKANYPESYVYNPNLSFWPETGWDKVMDYLTSGA